MKEINIEDDQLRRHLEQLPADTMHTFLLSEEGDGGTDAVRGAMLSTTGLVNEMRAAHELGILETLILGQAYTGALLMTRSLKGSGRLTLDIGCAGPAAGLAVEATASGEVRGYLKQTPIPLETPIESFDTAPFFGPGILTVSRYPDGSAQPFTGNVDLQYGNLGEDIANYYLVSEQTRTSVALSIRFDAAGRVVGAGGLFLEALPGASDAFLERVQQAVAEMASPADEFAAGTSPRELALRLFSSDRPRFLEERPVRFRCGCSRERFGSFIAAMKREDQEEMIENGPFPVVTVCHNCNSRYEFSRDELIALRELRRRN